MQDKISVVRLQMVKDREIEYGGCRMDSPKKAAEVIRGYLDGTDREQMVVCAVDVKGHPTFIQTVGIGTVQNFKYFAVPQPSVRGPDAKPGGQECNQENPGCRETLGGQSAEPHHNRGGQLLQLPGKWGMTAFPGQVCYFAVHDHSCYSSYPGQAYYHIDMMVLTVDIATGRLYSISRSGGYRILEDLVENMKRYVPAAEIGKPTVFIGRNEGNGKFTEMEL